METEVIVPHNYRLRIRPNLAVLPRAVCAIVETGLSPEVRMPDGSWKKIIGMKAIRFLGARQFIIELSS